MDITDTLPLGIASLQAHQAYLDGLGGSMAEPETFLRESAERTGERFGGRLATAFEVFSF